MKAVGNAVETQCLHSMYAWRLAIWHISDGQFIRIFFNLVANYLKINKWTLKIFNCHARQINLWQINTTCINDQMLKIEN